MDWAEHAIQNRSDKAPNDFKNKWKSRLSEGRMLTFDYLTEQGRVEWRFSAASKLLQMPRRFSPGIGIWSLMGSNA